MSRMDGKVVFITGGAGGIGAATGARIVAEGGRVVLFDRDEDGLVRAADPLGDAAVWVAGDVTSAEDQAAAVERAVETFGGLHGVFANAGIEGPVASLLDQDAEEFDRVLRINVIGSWLSVQAGVPALLDSGGGAILFTSSVASWMGSAGLGPYTASKHAQVGLMRTAAAELAESGIRVNSLHPGPVDNRMMRSIEDQAAPGQGEMVKEGFLQMIPMKRYGKNEEIAALATFLLSDDASYCHGQRFVADGGMLAT